MKRKQTKMRYLKSIEDMEFNDAINAIIEKWKSWQGEKKTDEDLAEQLGVAVITIRRWKMGDRRPSSKQRSMLIDIAVEQEQFFEAETLMNEELRSPGDKERKDADYIEFKRKRLGLYPASKTNASPDLDLFNFMKKKFDFEKVFNPFYITKRELWDRCESHWIESVLKRSFSNEEVERDTYLKSLPEDAKYYCGKDGRYYLLGNRDLVKLEQIEGNLKKYGAFLLSEKREEDDQVLDFLWRLSNKYPHITDASDHFDPEDYEPIIPSEEEVKEAEKKGIKLEPYYPKMPTDEEIQNMKKARENKRRVVAILYDLENGGDLWKEEYKKMLEQEVKEDGKR